MHCPCLEPEDKKVRGSENTSISQPHSREKDYLGSIFCSLCIFNCYSLRQVAVLESHVSVIRGLAVSNSGNSLISGSRDKVVNVWDLTAMKLATTYPIYETLETVGILQKSAVQTIGDKDVSGKELFYTAGDAGIIRIWDLRSGELVAAQKEEQGSKSGVSDVMYEPPSLYRVFFFFVCCCK